MTRFQQTRLDKKASLVSLVQSSGQLHCGDDEHRERVGESILLK